MDWSELLTISARLLDAHDSGHSPGTLTPIKEERAGSSDGVWLDVATQLLEFLNEYEAATNESWVPLGEFMSDMHERHGISVEDVRWIVNLLSTPTRISTVNEDERGVVNGASSTKSSALIERPRYKSADKCRLTRQGRTAVKLAKGVQGLLYSQYDAKKILLAIHHGEFSAALDQADAINQEVRGFSQELIQLLEQPVSQETRDTYEAQKTAYLEAIKSVDSTAEQALALFNTSEVHARFEEWAEKCGDAAPSPTAFRERLRDTVRSVQSLSGRMQRMISELIEARREVVGNIDFSRAALRLVFSPPHSNDLAGAIATLGPWFPVSAFPSAEDLLGTMPQLDEVNSVEMIFDDDKLDLDEPPSLLVEFLSTHGDVIRQLLDSGEPVSLSEAIAKGMMLTKGEESLSELIGVYVSPDRLQMDGVTLRVGFRKNQLDIIMPDGGRLWGDELVLEAIYEDKN